MTKYNSNNRLALIFSFLTLQGTHFANAREPICPGELASYTQCVLNNPLKCFPTCTRVDVRVRPEDLTSMRDPSRTCNSMKVASCGMRDCCEPCAAEEAIYWSCVERESGCGEIDCGVIMNPINDNGGTSSEPQKEEQSPNGNEATNPSTGGSDGQNVPPVTDTSDNEPPVTDTSDEEQSATNGNVEDEAPDDNADDAEEEAPETNDSPEDEAPDDNADDAEDEVPETNDTPDDEAPDDNADDAEDDAPETNDTPDDEAPDDNADDAEDVAPETNDTPDDEAPDDNADDTEDEVPETNDNAEDEPPLENLTDSDTNGDSSTIVDNTGTIAGLEEGMTSGAWDKMIASSMVASICLVVYTSL